MKNNIDDIINIHNIAFNSEIEGKLTLSLICKKEKLTLGHIVFSPIYNNHNQKIGVGLGPIGALPKYQKINVGSMLNNE